VEEVLIDGENALLADFLSPLDIAQKVEQALVQPQARLRQAARQTAVERFDLKRVCLPAQLELVQELALQHLPHRVARQPLEKHDAPGVLVAG
jgi:glycosyltransferase involved in cell wall biosynthesis